MDLSHPRFSANELGKFVFASDAEKRRIILSQKFPKPFVVNRYQPASQAILRSLKDGVFTEGALLEALEKLEAEPFGDKRKAERRQANVRGIKRFLTIREIAAPATGKHSIIRKNASFDFEGVTISVRPDIFTQCSNGKSFTYSKLRLSTYKYSADASEIVLLLMQKFAEQQDFESLTFDSSRARLIDCFSQQVFEAHSVSTYKGQLLMKALKEVQASGHL